MSCPFIQYSIAYCKKAYIFLLLLQLQLILLLNNIFKTQAITLVALIVAMILFSNLLVLGIAYWSGVQIHSGADLISLLEDSSNTGMLKSVVALNHLLTFTLSPLLFIGIFYRDRFLPYLSLNHFNPAYLLLFPLALFSLYPLMGYISFFIEKIEWPELLDNMDKDSMSALAGLLTMDHPSDLVVNILLLGVLPGIGEELLFRGVIQKEIIEKWQNPHTAIWITAIIFSLFHFQVTGFIPKMMIGAILGYAYYYSGSLILPMIIHALNNSFATVSLYLSGGKLDINTIETENIPLTGVVISTILFSYIWYTIRRTTSPIA